MLTWRWLATFSLVSPGTFIISSICFGYAADELQDKTSRTLINWLAFAKCTFQTLTLQLILYLHNLYRIPSTLKIVIKYHWFLIVRWVQENLQLIPSCWTALTKLRWSSGDQLTLVLLRTEALLSAWQLLSSLASASSSVSTGRFVPVDCAAVFSTTSLDFSCLHNCFRSTCCQMFLSSWILTGFIRKSRAPCNIAFIMIFWSSLADTTEQW